MTTYRIYKAIFPFDARDDSELTIQPDDLIHVFQNAQGNWPDQEKWMHGKNQDTNVEGDFPGNFVEFVEEIEPEPEVNHMEKVLPPLPPIPDRHPPPSRGGVQVFPTSLSPQAVTPPPPPSHSKSPTHRPMGHTNEDDEQAPPPPPRSAGRRVTPVSHGHFNYGQQLPVTENHQTAEEINPPQSAPGPPAPKPRPRVKRVSEPSKANDMIQVESEELPHSWMSVSYQIPVMCMACKLIGKVIIWYITD